MSLESVEKRRAEKQAALEAERDAQKATDLEAIEKLEDEHGRDNVRFMEVQYSAGLPVLVAVRCPSKNEVTRYQSRVRGEGGKPGIRRSALKRSATFALSILRRIYTPRSARSARVLTCKPACSP